MFPLLFLSDFKLAFVSICLFYLHSIFGKLGRMPQQAIDRIRRRSVEKKWRGNESRIGPLVFWARLYLFCFHLTSIRSVHNKLGVALFFLIFAVIPSVMLSILLTDANECIS